VIVTVTANLEPHDRRPEEAAMNLDAVRLATFLYVALLPD
jgi:ABC-type spermidine/putrescine transport system permease subunit II